MEHLSQVKAPSAVMLGLGVMHRAGHHLLLRLVWGLHPNQLEQWSCPGT